METANTSHIVPYHALGRDALTIYFLVFIQVVGLACSVVPGISKAQFIVDNAKFQVSSRSALVIANITLINSATKFITSKVISGLSDYVGRKPIFLLMYTLTVAGRIVILFANSEKMLYLAPFLIGMCDISIPVSQAWLSDLLEKHDRGKAFGLLIGLSYGLAFSIGLPLGAIVAQKVSLTSALTIPVVLPIVGAVVLAFSCVPDTFGIRDGSAENDEFVHQRYQPRRRRFPPDWIVYLRSQNPFTVFSLIRKAELNSWDWGTFVFGQAANKIFLSLIILFLQANLALTEIGAGVVLMSVGIGAAVFVPCFLNRYVERPAVMYGACSNVVGYALLAVSAVSGKQALPMAVVGLMFWTIGCVTLSAIQAIISMQYSADMQGELQGGLQQLGEFCFMLAYPVGILFSYTLRSDTSFSFSGIIWCISMFYYVLAVSVQLYSVPLWSSLFILQRRLRPSEADDGKTVLKEPNVNPVYFSGASKQTHARNISSKNELLGEL